ncbi:MAG: hypothetical protein AB8B71_02320 [Paracoccaceae bacterium]
MKDAAEITTPGIDRLGFCQAVADDFVFNLQRGATAQMIVAQMRDEYSQVLQSGGLYCDFILALARAAWRQGALYEALQREALELIDISETQGADMSELSTVRMMLSHPQPSQTIFSQESPAKRAWGILARRK